MTRSRLWTQSGTEQPALNQSPLRPELVEVPTIEAKREWARVSKQVYEVGPLVCPRCGGGMRILAFIERAEVVGKLLTHLALWPPHSHSPPASIAA